jgi:outer membrane biogenesis lipoprotein LolB
MKINKFIPIAIVVCALLAACTSGTGNKANGNTDTVRKDTSALHNTNTDDSTSLRIDSAKNQNADPTGRVK